MGQMPFLMPTNHQKDTGQLRFNWNMAVLMMCVCVYVMCCILICTNIHRLAANIMFTLLSPPSRYADLLLSRLRAPSKFSEYNHGWWNH